MRPDSEIANHRATEAHDGDREEAAVQVLQYGVLLLPSRRKYTGSVPQFPLDEWKGGDGCVLDCMHVQSDLATLFLSLTSHAHATLANTIALDAVALVVTNIVVDMTYPHSSVFPRYRQIDVQPCNLHLSSPSSSSAVHYFTLVELTLLYNGSDAGTKCMPITANPA